MGMEQQLGHEHADAYVVEHSGHPNISYHETDVP